MAKNVDSYYFCDCGWYLSRCFNFTTVRTEITLIPSLKHDAEKVRPRLLVEVVCFSAALILSVAISYFSIFSIYNPDLNNYWMLVDICKDFSCTVEPLFWAFAWISSASGGEGLPALFVLYTLYQFATLVFIALAARQVLDSPSSIIGCVALYLLCFAAIHLMIQIRFALANAIALYVIMAAVKKRRFSTILSVAAVLSHFSVAPFLTVLWFRFAVMPRMISMRSCFGDVTIIAGALISVVLLWAAPSLPFLPPFLSARIAGYITLGDKVPMSGVGLGVIISVVCLASALFQKGRRRTLLVIISASFLYYLAPLEIFVRFGVFSQYAIVILIMLDLEERGRLSIGSAVLVPYIVYKIFSSITYLAVDLQLN